MLELSRRASDRALEVLEPFGTPPGTRGSPWVVWHGPVHAEALIGVGRLDERELLDGMEPPCADAPICESDAPRGPRPGTPGGGRRQRGGRGWIPRIRQAAFDASGNRWGLARTALLAGEIHRRPRRRSQARAALEQAERLFGELGSVMWAAHARDQLQRIGAGRDEIGGLTPTQHQVAELAVAGLTNRQIGDRMFMSVHTVEAHLSAVYRALEIGGRRELGPALEGRAGVVGAADAPPKRD